LQQDILYRCDGRVTIADLADATKYTHPEIRAVLFFLSQHGLVRTLPPDPALCASSPPAPADLAPARLTGRQHGGLHLLKHTLRGWNDRFWYRLTWDVRRP
jgi:hypothetical protein